MRHIPKNSITSISASYQDGNFAAENLLDDHPGRIWNAGGVVRNATLKFGVSGGVSDVAIFNTNAKECSITAYDPNVLELSDNITLEGFSLGNVDYTATAAISIHEKQKTIWATLSLSQVVGLPLEDETELTDDLVLATATYTPSIPLPCIVEVNLTSTGGETLYAGIAQAGMAENYGNANPRYGAGRSRKDNSVESYNPMGYRYYKKTTLPRILPTTILMNTDEYLKLDSYVEEFGRVPSAWNLIENQDGWVIFGFPDLSGSLDYRTRSTVSLTINEVI